MRFVRVSSLGLVVAAVVLGGCASRATRKGSTADRFCINKREINSIGALDDQHAFVKLSASRFFLFTLEKRCRGFELVRGAALDDSTTRVCGDGASLLLFDDPAAGPMRCRIEQIESVSDRAAALALIEARAVRE